jgi:hypothetical protein
MSTKDGIISLIIILLIILVIIFGVRSATNSGRATAAENMSATFAELIRSDGYATALPACKGVGTTDFEAMTNCINEIKAPHDLSALFKESDYLNYDETHTVAGYIAIQNAKGDKTFESANFTLIQNNVEVATGCETPGTIAPGYACKFALSQRCNPGDNLEIKYSGTRVFLKTC